MYIRHNSEISLIFVLEIIMTVIQCSDETLKQEVYDIFTENYGYEIYSWDDHQEKIIENVCENPSFYDHVISKRNISVSTQLTQEQLTELMIGSSGVLNTKVTTALKDAIKNVLVSNPNIKYTGTYEFVDSLCKTLCFAFNDIYGMCEKGKISYYELYMKIYNLMNEKDIVFTTVLGDFIPAIDKTTLVQVEAEQTPL